MSIIFNFIAMSGEPTDRDPKEGEALLKTGDREDRKGVDDQETAEAKERLNAALGRLSVELDSFMQRATENTKKELVLSDLARGYRGLKKKIDYATEKITADVEALETGETDDGKMTATDAKIVLRDWKAQKASVEDFRDAEKFGEILFDLLKYSKDKEEIKDRLEKAVRDGGALGLIEAHRDPPKVRAMGTLSSFDAHNVVGPVGRVLEDLADIDPELKKIVSDEAEKSGDLLEEYGKELKRLEGLVYQIGLEEVQK